MTRTEAERAVIEAARDLLPSPARIIVLGGIFSMVMRDRLMKNLLRFPPPPPPPP